jgi:acetyltransferase-like isoleucine patch superfamily enzyme
MNQIPSQSYGKNDIGAGCIFFNNTTLGFPSKDNLVKTDFRGAVIGKKGVIRSGTIIYSDVWIGDNFSSGHNVLIRENTRIGNNVSVGSSSIIEGRCTIGDNVSIQSMVYIPTDVTIEDNVFIGPNVVLTNDKYPPKGGENLQGPVIGEGASLGANSTILPGIKIGRGSLVAAGAIVTKDVPGNKLAIGSPAVIKELPEGARR